MTEREPQIIRPVSFLGNKLRVLDTVVDTTIAGLADGDGVWDAFAGSTVVSQAFAARGMRVAATDMLSSSVTFGRAFLQAGQAELVAADIDALMQSAAALRSEAEDKFTPWVLAERKALESADGADLLRLGAEMPQRWKKLGASPELLLHFRQVEAVAATRMPHPHPESSSTYAGTYFGINQALDIDAIRAAIEPWSREHSDPVWVRNLALTALCMAASRAVFSAGKHFAQPHAIRDGKNHAFHERRALADRSVNVHASFAESLSLLAAEIKPGSRDHSVWREEAQNVDGSKLRALGVKAVYADPPYTAQQYSRFYHVLDTIVDGRPEPLQHHRGEVTRGLYPEQRYKSPFCSRVAAPGAFENVIRAAREADARIVISYSMSAAGSVGNARSIALDRLMTIVRNEYGNASVTKTDVKYRQFNNAAASVSGRDDPEVMIVGDVDA